jgi:hypothetical protein
MTISPNGPFKDGQAVTVAGSGFIANSTVRVGECPNDDCEGRWQTVPITENGSFVVTLSLQQRYIVEVGTSGGGEEPSEIDCAQPYTCFVVAQESTPPYKAPASIPLTFSATAAESAVQMLDPTADGARFVLSRSHGFEPRQHVPLDVGRLLPSRPGLPPGA